DGLKNASGNALLAANVFANHADEGFAAFIFDIGELAEVCGDLGQLLIRVNGERDGNFGGGDHIDGALVAVEDLEDGAQVAVRHQHAAGDHVDDGESALNRDGLEWAAAMRGERDDARAFVFRIAGVEHKHRDIFLDRREDCGRVQDLGSEVGEFGGFF